MRHGLTRLVIGELTCQSPLRHCRCLAEANTSAFWRQEHRKQEVVHTKPKQYSNRPEPSYRSI
jgi:hypothetical protein